MSNLLTRNTSDWQDTAHVQIASSISNATVHQIPRPNLSNRCSFCIRNVFPTPTIAMSPSIGIDKIAVEIPLATGMGDPNLFLSSIKNTLMGRWATKATTKHQGTGATIRWQFIKARWSIRLELNPSRFIDPDGYSLASPSSTVHVIREVIREFMLESDDALPLFVVAENGQIDLDNWREDWTSLIRVGRLDTTVDIQVDSDEFNFEFYKEVRPKYAKAIQITYGKKGKAETWNGVYSSRDGFVRMYDKTAQVNKTNPASGISSELIRFEYRLERKSLARAHVHTLLDINPTKFEYALKIGWEASKAGSVVNDPLSWEKRVHHSDLNRLEKLELTNYLRSGRLENSDEEMPKEFDWAKLAKKAGISLSKPLSRQWKKAMFLDLQTQKLIFI